MDYCSSSQTCFWKRDEYYANSSCSNSEFWTHIAETTDSENIMFTNCTSPLVKIQTYNNIVDQYYKIKNLNDSLNTATEEKHFLYMENKALNFDPKKAPNSQDLPNIKKLNFAVNIISKKLMFKKKSIIGNKPFFFMLDEIEGFDIDTPYDFEFAEYLHKKYFKDNLKK